MKQFQVGDLVEEIGGGKFRAIVTWVGFDRIWVSYIEDGLEVKGYVDNYRKLSKLEKALK